jgi:type 1 glutamine amidotransferase
MMPTLVANDACGAENGDMRFAGFLNLRCVIALCACVAACAVQAAETRPLKIVLLIAAKSYETDRTLPAFVAEWLQPTITAVVVNGAMEAADHRFNHLEELDRADVLLVSVWRRAPPADQLARIRNYVQSGRPVVGVCTASHAFTPVQTEIVQAGRATWPEWDAQVIGGHYTGHHSIRLITHVTAADPTHPILTGVVLPFASKMELNRVSPLQPGAHAILTGSVDAQPAEPVAWTFTNIGGGRTFFTPLGHPEDFSNPAFARLLANGIRWAANLPIPADDARNRRLPERAERPDVTR